MTDLFWLSHEQLDRIKPYFPLSHEVPRADDYRILETFTSLTQFK